MARLIIPCVVTNVAPTTGDDSADGYRIGTFWVDTVTQKLYVATDVTIEAAVWKESGSVSDLAAHLADATDAHDASAISNVPAGNIAATDQQGVNNELDTEKRNLAGDLPMADGTNITVSTTTGTKVGTAASQKLAIWGVTPVVQPAAAGQAAAAAQGQTTLVDSTGGTPSTTLAAITAGIVYTQADMTAVKNALASVAAALALIKTDMANVKTLQDATRTALVNTGVIKGSA